MTYVCITNSIDLATVLPMFLKFLQDIYSNVDKNKVTERVLAYTSMVSENKKSEFKYSIIRSTIQNQINMYNI